MINLVQASTAAEILWFMSSNPVLRQKEAPTLAKVDEVLDKFVGEYIRTGDANDVLYAVEASHDYDPGKRKSNRGSPAAAGRLRIQRVKKDDEIFSRRYSAS
jgi:homoserine acetyltransferase